MIRADAEPIPDEFQNSLPRIDLNARKPRNVLAELAFPVPEGISIDRMNHIWNAVKEFSEARGAAE